VNDADASQHGGDEGLDPRHDPHEDIDLGIGDPVKDPSHTRERGSHHEGEGNGVVDVDPHKRRGLLVIGYGPHGGALPRPVDEQVQERKGEEGDGKDEYLHVGEGEVDPSE
jgi:hypothetical protein